MTKPQIWVASFLLLFLILFVLGQLTKKEDTDKDVQEQNPVPQSDLSSQNVSAPELMGKLGCITCHGSDLTGTRMGPALQGLKENWGRDKLINFLRNPFSYMETERFIEFRKKYPGVIMPSFNQIDVKELGKIADYLLQLE
jgi:mono/diheme cytochrome c family protein